MAFSDILALADDKLADVFNRKEVDPAKARAPIVKTLDKAVDQFASATPVKGRKIFKVANGVAKIELPFAIGGKSTFHVPVERFNDFIAKVKKEVVAGNMDKEIAARPSTITSNMKRVRTGGGGGGKGWSEERRAAYAATIAARKAAEPK